MGSATFQGQEGDGSPKRPTQGRKLASIVMYRNKHSYTIEILFVFGLKCWRLEPIKTDYLYLPTEEVHGSLC